MIWETGSPPIPTPQQDDLYVCLRDALFVFRFNCDWKRGSSKTGEYDAISCHFHSVFCGIMVLLSCPWFPVGKYCILKVWDAKTKNPNCSRWAQAGRHTQHALNRLSGKNCEFHSVKWACLKILHCTCQVCFLHFVLYHHHRNHEITKSLSTGPPNVKAFWRAIGPILMAKMAQANGGGFNPVEKY